MKNYTTIIGKVLMEWLHEKGWSGHSVRVEKYSSLGIYDAIYETENRDKTIVPFTQSDLDGVKGQFPLPNGEDTLIFVRDNIRAELERQCSQSENDSTQGGTE